MICLRLIIVGLLSCMGQIFGSHHDIKNNSIKDIDIVVSLSAVTNGCVSASSPMNLKKCLKFGIKATINEPFVFIDNIKNFTLNRTLSIVHSKMDTHDSLLFYDVKNNKRIEDVEQLCTLKKEHKDLINFIQEATFGLNAIPAHLLISQDSRKLNVGDRTCNVIVMNRALITIGEETYNIIVSAFQENVEDFERLKACNDSLNMQLKNQPSSYLSYLKKPFFGLLLIAVCYAIYHNVCQ